MATTRLRQAFKFPAENSDEDDIREDLDEEEQETLILTLRRKNDERNEQYTLALLALPLILIPLYLLPHFNRSNILLSLLSITSLLSTAYTILFIATPPPPPSLLSSSSSFSSTAQGVPETPLKRLRTVLGAAPTTLKNGEGGPLNRYLPYLNTVLSTLLALMGFWLSFSGRSGSEGDEWVIWVGPGVVHALTTLAQTWMRSVDINELENLRYRYKGA
ncbi:MAG: hypothetical protein M1827_005426 [Pycnora praestabilis]|nr:MAG: hypothetical protein M1827_005426 [Pycnora praestabilis]